MKENPDTMINMTDELNQHNIVSTFKLYLLKIISYIHHLCKMKILTLEHYQSKQKIPYYSFVI